MLDLRIGICYSKDNASLIFDLNQRSLLKFTKSSLNLLKGYVKDVLLVLLKKITADTIAA